MELLNSIKAAFKDKTIEITVSEAMDETEYLLSSEANRDQLENSIREHEQGHTVTMTVQELQEKYKP